MGYLLSFVLNFYGFNKVKISLNYFLIDNTDLIVGLVITKTLKSFFCSYQIGGVEFYRIEDSIVGNAAFYHIIFLPKSLPFSVSYDKVKPFSSILAKLENSKI